MVLSSLLLRALFLGKPFRSQRKTDVTISSQIGKHVIRAEVASTLFEHVRGLMFRDDLKDGEGMLFVFPTEKVRTFWMKNTMIPLDIIFISAEGNIVTIARNALCGNDPLETYRSTSPARYVIEVNAGYAERQRINEGDRIVIAPIT